MDDASEKRALNIPQDILGQITCLCVCPATEEARLKVVEWALPFVQGRWAVEAETHQNLSVS